MDLLNAINLRQAVRDIAMRDLHKYGGKDYLGTGMKADIYNLRHQGIR